MAKIKVTSVAADEAPPPDKKVMVSVAPSESAISGPNDDTIDIHDSAGLKSGKYSKTHIQNLAKAAKATGINPYQLVALSLQESGIGTATPRATSTGRVGYRNKKTPNFLGQVGDFEPAQQAELEKLSASTGIDPTYLKPAIVLRDKLKYAKQLGFNNEDMQLQAYNGYGKLLPKKDASGKNVPTRYYGLDVPETGLDMRKTPLYGRRLMALKSDLMKSKDINNLINGE